jgi:predicted nucleic acid-binding protein
VERTAQARQNETPTGRSVIVLDTGALIALERRKRRMLEVWASARLAARPVLVPGAVVAEWWRGRTDRRDAILAGVSVVPVDEPVGRASGEALAAIPGTTVVDAIVMAVAARIGAVVYTSDVGDLERLRAFFPGVRVLST